MEPTPSPKKPAALASLFAQGVPAKPTRHTRTMIRMKDGTQCVEIDGKYHVWLPEKGGTVGPEYKIPKDPMTELQHAPPVSLCPKKWLQLTESPSPSSFCVASYNVMADVFSPPSQFPTHNPAHVGWMHRGPRIAQEIADVRADLLCLQELGADPEGAHLRPLLTSRGYEYLYKPNAWREGCAVYWRKDMFEKIEGKSFDYPTLAKVLLPSAQASGDTLVVRLCEAMQEIKHHSVLVLVLLKHKPSGVNIAVLTSHLYWGAAPTLNLQLQCLQMHLALDQLDQLCKTCTTPPAVLVCGDFNSPATGGLRRFIEEGKLSPTHPDWSANESRTSSLLSHPFSSLSSAYQALNHPITHAEDSFKACIDYIYHSKNIVVTSLLELPDAATLAPLPTDDYPSDHLMIAMQCSLQTTHP